MANKEENQRHPYFQRLQDDLKMIEQSARRSGRSQALLESLKDGDIFIVASLDRAQHFIKRLQAMNKNVHVCVASDQSGYIRAIHQECVGLQGSVVPDHEVLHLLCLERLHSVEKFTVQMNNRNKPFQPLPKISDWT